MTEPSAEELRSQLSTIKEAMKANGFASITELIEAYQSVSAERDQAVVARDKFNTANTEAQAIIRSKASEIGQLKQQVTELGNGIVAPVAPKPDPDSPPTEPSLEEVEAKMTDDQWDIADKLLEGIEDVKQRIKYVEDEKERKKFLSRIISDTDFKPVPTSFRRKKKDEPDPKDSLAELFNTFKQKHDFAPAGPSRKGFTGRAPSQSYDWNSARAVDKRVR